MPVLKIRNMANGNVQWRHHNQLRKRTIQPLTDSSTVRVRLTGANVRGNRTNTNDQTNKRQTRSSNKSLEATPTNTQYFTPDFDEISPLRLPNHSESNENLSTHDPTDNDAQNSRAGTGGEQIPDAVWGIMQARGKQLLIPQIMFHPGMMIPPLDRRQLTQGVPIASVWAEWINMTVHPHSRTQMRNFLMAMVRA